jgi:hypothetical protein
MQWALGIVGALLVAAAVFYCGMLFQRRNYKTLNPVEDRVNQVAKDVAKKV